MGEYELLGEYDLCVNMSYGWIWIKGGGTDTNTNTQTHRHMNTMTRPGLRAGPSENIDILVKL